MKHFTRSRAAVVLGAFAAALLPLILCGCATMGINKGQINLVSSDDEVKMGQEMSVEVAKEYAICDDAAVTAYVQGVGDRIARVCDRREIAYHFAVVKKDEVNAFALPGGYIYVYTGLMKDIDDEAQLASVIAHEIAHVTARHATERLTAMYGTEFFMGIVFGKNPGLLGQIVKGIGTPVGFLAYSRANEYEADDLGARYLGAAGYDPRGMIDLLGKLKGLEASEPTKFETWLMTHPATSERLARVEATVTALPKSASSVRNAAAYAKIKSRLPN